MENINENVVAEEVVETPVVEEAPAVEAPVDEPTPVETVTEEVHVEEPKPFEPEATEQISITSPSYSRNDDQQHLGSVNGVIGATTAPREPRKTAKKAESSVKETVALFSTKNVTWTGVGKVYRGYNIVEKDAADQWLTRSHIRVATPEEVAREFGK